MSQITPDQMMTPPPRPAQVIVQASVQTTSSRYSIKHVRSISILMIILSLLFMILGSVETYLSKDEYFYTKYVCSAIWSGLFYLVASSLGLATVTSRLRSKIVSFMVMSILSAVIGLAPIIDYFMFRHSNFNSEGGKLAIFYLILILSLLLPILSCISSGFCCQVICCNSSNQQLSTLISQTSDQMTRSPPQSGQAINVPCQNSIVLQKYSKKHVKNLSTSIIICSVLLILFGIAAVVLGEYQRNFIDIGGAIWSGLLFLATGWLGLSSAHTCLRYKIISFMTMTIVSSFIGLFPFINYSIFLELRNIDNDCRHQFYYFEFDEDCLATKSGRLAVYSMIVILSLALEILSIISSGFCCHAMSCGSLGQPMTLIYYAQPDNAVQSHNTEISPPYEAPPPYNQNDDQPCTQSEKTAIPPGNPGNPNLSSLETSMPPPYTKVDQPPS